jgi:hypothetical protein
MELEKSGYMIKSLVIQPNSISTKAYLPIDEIVAVKEIIKKTQEDFQRKQAEMQRAMELPGAGQ